MRLLFVAAMIYGLWQSSPWARWVAITFGIVFGAAGLFGVWVTSQVGLFDERPSPLFDYAVLVLTSVVLFAAAVVLLLPRRAERGL